MEQTSSWNAYLSFLLSKSVDNTNTCIRNRYVSMHGFSQVSDQCLSIIQHTLWQELLRYILRNLL